jgi:hypothetical protein
MAGIRQDLLRLWEGVNWAPGAVSRLLAVLSRADASLARARLTSRPGRLVFDRNTGKAKGYGFCEFEDAETAASAVRNLNDVDVGGRCLRIDRAEEDPLFEGRTTQMGQMDEALPPRGARGPRAFGPGARGGFGGAPPGATDGGWGNRGGPGGPGAPPAQLPPNLPPGQNLPPGADPTDAISQTLASLPPGKLLDVMAQMKVRVGGPRVMRRVLTPSPGPRDELSRPGPCSPHGQPTGRVCSVPGAWQPAQTLSSIGSPLESSGNVDDERRRPGHPSAHHWRTGRRRLRTGTAAATAAAHADATTAGTAVQRRPAAGLRWAAARLRRSHARPSTRPAAAAAAGRSACAGAGTGQPAGGPTSASACDDSFAALADTSYYRHS